MGIAGRALTYVATAATVSAGGYMVSNQVLPEAVQPKRLASYIELYAKRQQNPLLSQDAANEILKKGADASNNPLDQLAEIQAVQNAKPEEADLGHIDDGNVVTAQMLTAQRLQAEQTAAAALAAQQAEIMKKIKVLEPMLAASIDVDDRYRTAELQKQIADLKAQMSPQVTAPQPIQGQVAQPQPQSQPQAAVNNVGNRQNVVVVANGNSANDQNAEQRIRELIVPDKVKQEILDNYHRTGILPAILTENRSPASNK